MPTKPTEFIPNDLQLGMRHMAFTVKNTDAVTARLKKAGVEFTLDPLDATGGVRIAFFKDPDGTLCEIIQGEIDLSQYWSETSASICARQRRAGQKRIDYDHTSITVANIDKTLAFYQGILGFPVLGQLVFHDERGFLITYLQCR